MAKIPVFFSFHYGNDAMRAQQVRNMGTLEGDQPVSPNDWEQLKRSGDAAVRSWIDQNMKYKRCVIVLIGSETADRPWVRYEIEKAWNDGKPLLGIHIHNLRCPRTGTATKGRNPFDLFRLSDGRVLSQVVDCYDPWYGDAYRDIATHIGSWINTAISARG